MILVKMLTKQFSIHNYKIGCGKDNKIATLLRSNGAHVTQTDIPIPELVQPLVHKIFLLHFSPSFSEQL